MFAIFRKYPVPSIDNILEFIEYMQYRYIFLNNTTVCIPCSMKNQCKTSISLYTALFLNERDKL